MCAKRNGRYVSDRFSLCVMVWTVRFEMTTFRTPIKILNDLLGRAPLTCLYNVSEKG